MQKLTLCLAALSGVLAASAWSAAAAADDIDERQIWSAGNGHMELEIRGDYLTDFGIEVLHRGEPITTRKNIEFPVNAIEPVQINAPWGNLESIRQKVGLLSASPDLVLKRGSSTVSLEHIQLRPGQSDRGYPEFIAFDQSGNELFTLTYMHIEPHADTSILEVSNAGMQPSASLAKALQFEELTQTYLGNGRLQLDLQIPRGANTSGRGPTCDDRPIWPQEGVHEADVSLISIGSFLTAPNGSSIKIAADATLKNVGLADIPWIPQFGSLSSPEYDYTPSDQHPYLVWNLYKINSDRIRMLSASGVKHAFLTINVNCTSCGSSNVLWPECEDIYYAGTNDQGSRLGPRDEIEASLGLWDNCGSFFDPECTGSQTDSSSEFENRMVVDTDEFEDSQSQFFFDSWYVVQYDKNIWNGMGFKPVDPEPAGGGWVMNPGAFSQGPVISEWVAEDNNDPMADHDVIVVPSETPEADYPGNMPQGHLRLLVKVTETEPGRYRYNYALQNYDFDRAMEGLRIDIPDGATVHDTWFGDIDDDAGNDWTITVNNDHVLFEAPPDNPLTWFTLFNFEVEVEAEPETGQVVLDLGQDAVTSEVSVDTLAPSTVMGLLFRDKFESPVSN